VIGPEDAAGRESSIEEINARIPRRVRISGDASNGFWIVLALVLGGLIEIGGYSYHSVQRRHQRDALRRDGREVSGTITRILSGHGAYIDHLFRVDEAVYQNEVKMPEDLRLNQHVGDAIAIQFLPSDPSVNYPSGWAWWTWWDFVPQLFVVWFSGIGWVGLGYIYRERRFARIGWVTTGKVVACAPKRDKFRVDYEFRADDGAEFDGANESSYDEYATGATIRVIYMRKNPKRNDMYPLADFPPVEE
jgi:hypothetical protein